MTAGRRARNARGWGFTAEIDIADRILFCFISLSLFDYTVCHGKCMSSNLLRLMSSSGVFLYSIDLWLCVAIFNVKRCRMEYELGKSAGGKLEPTPTTKKSENVKRVSRNSQNQKMNYLGVKRCRIARIL